ncbi:hypothetical protein PMAYCL1PPCAC_08909 [Pristionchus mayeri]|uniref:Secreted protein n=1 Tax=Pristionchus mayeri TaxID=1317129 RepID=A0AAN4ZFU7_9BILA|nr:hypothetical protein PMAYCL1PPCAC_08909 [Pristionchus mayeri]
MPKFQWNWLALHFSFIPSFPSLLSLSIEAEQSVSSIGRRPLHHLLPARSIRRDIAINPFRIWPRCPEHRQTSRKHRFDPEGCAHECKQDFAYWQNTP